MYPDLGGATLYGLIVALTVYFVEMTTAQLLVPFALTGVEAKFTILDSSLLAGLMAMRYVLGLRTKAQL